ncbi:hypothetical protein GCK72_012617 [Caenorhabditis remanei]|uniref:Uncharacterized protein n=1 Tax=Caenorhabditis remanei TaxID=31234 RepID=A0A6A5GND7_CAERE|nr:hypothetical protein GCK72_012617 [Caenorhabditis remanei]KAF1756164.1 hypothetical protein GCK72_012617 [Caenorhabditis remanei]
MDDMKREAARRNWRRLVKKINSNKQNGVKNCGGGERGQLRQAGRKKVPAAISVPHGEPGPLMLCNFSVFSDRGFNYSGEQVEEEIRPGMGISGLGAGPCPSNRLLIGRIHCDINHDPGSQNNPLACLWNDC